MPTTFRRFYRPALHTFAALAVSAGLVLTGASTDQVSPSGVTEADLVLTSQAEESKSAGRRPGPGTSARKKSSVSRGDRVVRTAAAQAGDPYRYGATGPDAFDCSGLTSFAYRVGGRKQIPRTSSAQRAATRRISATDARRGDLVFFHNSGGVYHVGIYAGVIGGARMVWHSPKPGSRVHRARIWTSAVSYGRVA
jgi:cell wall-associated NlpC family hydrolase